MKVFLPRLSAFLHTSIRALFCIANPGQILLVVITSATFGGCGGGGGGGKNSFTNAISSAASSVASVPVMSSSGPVASSSAISSVSTSSAASSTDWKAGVFDNESKFANKCMQPRTGIDPNTGKAYPDTQGTYKDENNFLRSWSNNTYLWYNEIVDRDPALYPDTRAYFDLLKTFAKTSDGLDKDRFHFVYDTAEWEDSSGSGISYGYGMEFAFLNQYPPRELIVAYTQPGSPAAAMHIPRGAKILEIDGIDFVNTNDDREIDLLNAALFTSAVGEVHTFEYQAPGSVTATTVTLQSARVTRVPVQNVKTINTVSGKVGYLSFHDHIATAESGLVDAVGQLSAAGIVDLVIDLRYNGGGFLDIASELAYMVAGYSATNNKTFEKLQFNDKYKVSDPITGETLAPMPFHQSALGFSVSEGQALPSLNLNRVYVLTSADTCSASESLINGLRGVGVEVIQIGSTTCGKPYGFYPESNCGTTYFTAQFRGVNAKDFGDYNSGFSPSTIDDGKAAVAGCMVGDDLTHDLGDVAEKRLAAALSYRLTNQCPAASLGVMRKASQPLQDINASIIKNSGLQNKLLRR